MRSAFVRILAVGSLALSFVGIGHAQGAWQFPDFAATQVFESRRADMAMKVYRFGSNVRIESTATLSTLYVPESSKIYSFTIYPDHSRTCVGMNPEQATMLPSPLELLQGKILKRKMVGSEVVEGHVSKVEEVSVAQPGGKVIESKVWEAEDLKGIPVKIESHLDELTLTAVYRDIVIGTPDATLFSVPDRCIPFEKMGQVAESRILK